LISSSRRDRSRRFKISSSDGDAETETNSAQTPPRSLPVAPIIIARSFTRDTLSVLKQVSKASGKNGNWKEFWRTCLLSSLLWLQLLSQRKRMWRSEMRLQVPCNGVGDIINYYFLPSIVKIPRAKSLF